MLIVLDVKDFEENSELYKNNIRLNYNIAKIVKDKICYLCPRRAADGETGTIRKNFNYL